MPTAAHGFVDLHRHLDGSLRWNTVLELAHIIGLRVPEPLHFSAGMGLPAALQRFAFTTSLLRKPAHLTRVAAEMCADAQNEGLEALEIRFAPQILGLEWDVAIDAVLDGLSPQAGLIVCGLYGESPDVIERLVSMVASRSRVVGVDLAGGPLASHRWQLKDYAEAFTRAGRLGLGVTIHAGEGRPSEEIRDAVLYLGAHRIGHGVSLMDDPATLELILKRDVIIEACPTSNLHTGAISSVAEHPIKTWLDVGVSVAVCTDNTLLSGIDLPTEIHTVQQACGLSQNDIRTLRRMSCRARFRRR